MRNKLKKILEEFDPTLKLTSEKFSDGTWYFVFGVGTRKNELNDLLESKGYTIDRDYLGGVSIAPKKRT